MKKFIVILSSCFGLGFIPIASGTFASLFAILPYYFLIAHLNNVHSLPFYLLIIAVFSLFAIWVSNKAEKIFNEKDSHKIVIDEVAGFFFAMVLLPPFSIGYIIATFFLFRIYDVWKPYPIRSSQNLKGGLGVVVDDLLAGFYACFTLHIFIFLKSLMGGLLWMV